jgi:hypothetical protein
MTTQIPDNNLKIIISAIRFAGILIFFFGMILLFNFGEVAEKMNMVNDGMNKIIGMVMAIFGIIEVILTPRILEAILQKNRK